MIHEEIVEALNSLVPNAKWQLTGDDYSDINWIDGDKPTVEELQNEIELLPQRKAAKQAEAAAKRQALLDRLGITEEEAKLLLG